MANILYLVHRLPYPPNKGDKVRSYHLLKHLARQHRVFLGTFIDDPEDEPHIATLRELCADIHVVRLAPASCQNPESGWLSCGRSTYLELLPQRSAPALGQRNLQASPH